MGIVRRLRSISAHRSHSNQPPLGGATAPFAQRLDWLPKLGVLLWIHLVATGLYLGATAALALFAVPSARRVEDPLRRRRQISRVLRAYDPTAIGLLGIMLMTGAWSITGMKQALGGDYFESFGQFLAWKLGLAFFVLFFGVYIAMGIGHRIVREDDWSDEVDADKLSSMMSRIVGMSWFTVGLTLATIAVAVGR